MSKPRLPKWPTSKSSPFATETELANIAKRATTVFMCKPGLRDCGANIVASVIGPTVVYPLVFAKALKKTVETVESGYGNMLRRSIGVAQGFPWEVLSGSPEFDGLGALRLTTEATKARLRQFQSMISSTYDSETSLAMGMLRMAQRWCGVSHPVNMMNTNQARLLHKHKQPQRHEHPKEHGKDFERSLPVPLK